MELRVVRSQFNKVKGSQTVITNLPPLAPRVTTKSDNVEPFIPDLLPDGLAPELYSDFLELILPQYPVVAISESFDTLRASKSILLVATITAASSLRDPALFETLHSCLARQITDKAIIDGGRSLELVQSILILGTWYYPPNDLQRLNFYQWFHIAGTMALQLGLGSLNCQQEPQFSGQQLENQRTLFTVYQSCSSVAISLRRRSMMSFTRSAQQCLATFEASANSCNDKRLIAWLKLQLVVEDLEKKRSQTLLEEAMCGFDDIRERYEQWERAIEPGVLNGESCFNL